MRKVYVEKEVKAQLQESIQTAIAKKAIIPLLH